LGREIFGAHYNTFLQLNTRFAFPYQLSKYFLLPPYSILGESASALLIVSTSLCAPLSPAYCNIKINDEVGRVVVTTIIIVERGSNNRGGRRDDNEIKETIRN
jgi:hypothetical protein